MPYLTRYLEHYRLLFPHRQDEQALWLSAKGGALTGDAIYVRVCRRTEDSVRHGNPPASLSRHRRDHDRAGSAGESHRRPRPPYPCQRRDDPAALHPSTDHRRRAQVCCCHRSVPGQQRQGGAKIGPPYAFDRPIESPAISDFPHVPPTLLRQPMNTTNPHSAVIEQMRRQRRRDLLAARRCATSRLTSGGSRECRAGVPAGMPQRRRMRYALAWHR